MSLAPGTEFAGYTIVRRIGVGGMGEVYLADHPRLPRQDVVKVLSEHFTDDATFRARFVREAELAARLDHPSIVSVYDRGEADGRLWIAMQYAPGVDAAELVARSPSGLPAADVCAIAESIGAALDHAHRHGLLHRDVKPANILISDPDSPERRIRLADFGIARLTDGDASLTSSHMVIGSFPYSSPEQLTGEPLDGRTDVYSLACTVYELLVGRTPFPPAGPAVLIHHHLTVDPPPITDRRPDLPDVLARAVRHGLAKQPADRPPTASEFAAELRAATGTTARAEPTGPTKSPEPAGETLRIRMRAHVPAPGSFPIPEQATERHPRPRSVPPPPRPRSTRSTRPRAEEPQHTAALSTSERPAPAAPPFAPPPFAASAPAAASTADLDHRRAERLATQALACSIAALPLSVVGGIGIPLGAAGLHLANRSQSTGPRPPAAALARVLSILAIAAGLAMIVGVIVAA